MKISKKTALAVSVALLAVPEIAIAQMGNIVVTGSRRDDYQYYDDEQSAIGFRIKADYFAQQIYVSSDSRDATQRNDELMTMLRNTIEMAPAAGIELTYGNFELKPLTLANIDELRITGGQRPDTSRVAIYAQMKVSNEVATEEQAREKVKAFVESVPVTGRSFIDRGGIDLTVINPDQYRHRVVREVANESKAYATMFGSDYGIEIRGLDSELAWTQVSENEVLLYIPHNFVIKPK
jgi:hypothetical protein